MGYVLAQVQIRWGNRNLEQFNRAVTVLARLMAEQGVELRQALLTQFGGQLYEVWNLWEVADASHMNRARAALRSGDEYHETHVQLTEVVQSEQLRYLESLPYAPTEG